ncbi:MAG: hypothetical protein R2705_24545 [Ilumatobacteraceae bacterium]
MELLTELADQGLTRHIPARDLWQLTPDGREHHATELPKMVGEAADGLRIPTTSSSS